MTAWPRLRVHVHEERIRAGINPEGNLEAIARLRHPAAVPVLESSALRRNDQALRLLRLHYPESRFVTATREWEALRGHPYLNSAGHLYLHRDADEPHPEQVPQIRAWLDRYPRHPGRDDALAVLAIDPSREDPIESLRSLHDAYHAPDGDKQQTVAALFNRYLASLAPADRLQQWLESDCPPHVRGAVRYALAVMWMREHRFAEAVPLFDETLRSGESAGWELSGPGPETKIREQAAACRRVAEQTAAAAAAATGKARAAIIHAMARRCFREDALFVCHLPVRRTVWSERGDRDGPPAAADLSDGNHYAQARRYFAQISREHPTYGEIAAVEYSLPLCLWRLRRDWTESVGQSLDGVMAGEFQAFADRHPQSSMADDALYLAGIHSLVATEWKDATGLRRNFTRIIEDYPEGDVLATYLTECEPLQRAVVARRFPELGAR